MKINPLCAAALMGAFAIAPAAYLFANDKLAAEPASATTAKEEGFQSLFDGKSLDGWQGREGFWSVQDGAITGQTKEAFKGPNTFLVWKGGEVADFELRFKYKIVGGNSGVQYRSKMLDDNKSGQFRVGGYQADFEAGKTYSGILYEEGGRGILAQRGTKVTITPDGKKQVEKLPMSSEQLQAAIKPEEWNEYTIIAKGNHLTHQINGHTTAEVIDQAPQAAKSGLLALQLHAGPPMAVQFKDIRIKKLEGAK